MSLAWPCPHLLYPFLHAAGSVAATQAFDGTGTIIAAALIPIGVVLLLSGATFFYVRKKREDKILSSLMAMEMDEAAIAAETVADPAHVDVQVVPSGVEGRPPSRHNSMGGGGPNPRPPSRHNSMGGGGQQSVSIITSR